METIGGKLFVLCCIDIAKEALLIDSRSFH